MFLETNWKTDHVPLPPLERSSSQGLDEYFSAVLFFPQNNQLHWQDSFNFFVSRNGENSDNLSSLRYLWICLICRFGSTEQIAQSIATRDKDNLPMPQDAEHGDQSVKTQEKNCGMTAVWFPSLGMVYLYVMPGFWARWNMSWKRGEGKYYHIFSDTTYMMCLTI